MLVGVALVGAIAGYVAHERQIIAQRKSWLASHQQPMFHVNVMRPDGTIGPPPEPAIPRIRQWLGDRPVPFVSVLDPVEEDAAKNLFPEATVIKNFDGYAR